MKTSRNTNGNGRSQNKGSGNGRDGHNQKGKYFYPKYLQEKLAITHQVWLRVPQTRGGVYIINPGHLASLTGEECPFFLLDQPQRFARGITCLFDDIPLRKAETIKSQLIAHLGRNTYYRCKQKKRLVRPKEQAYIKKLFLAQGITEEPKYDEYMEYYDLDRD